MYWPLTEQSWFWEILPMIVFSTEYSQLMHWITATQMKFHHTLKYFDLKSVVSNYFLYFKKNLIDNHKKIKDSWYLVQIQTRCCSSMCMYNCKSEFWQSLPAYRLLSKENKKSAKCPAHLVSIDKKGCDLFACELEAFITDVYNHCSVSSRYTGALNKNFGLYINGMK